MTAASVTASSGSTTGKGTRMRNAMQIKLPASITGATVGRTAASGRKPAAAARDLPTSGWINAPRRPTAAPRRGAY